MNIESRLQEDIKVAFSVLFNAEISLQEVKLQPTRKEFEGTHTFVTFPYARVSKKAPQETAQILGEHLLATSAIVSKFNVLKGFLNISLEDSIWISTLEQISKDKNFGQFEAKNQNVMVEFSSPNTNKPLHLGHLRNNFLGDSLSRILSANGYTITKNCLINDRGIHICKSMVAYERFGEGETPQSSGIKGDHLAGKYYVKFNTEDKRQLALQNTDNQGVVEKYPKKKPTSKIFKEAQELLQKWEQNDPKTMALWNKMNDWVYEGFNQSYKSIGVSFDKIYKESNTYILGKDIVQEGLKKGVFSQREDGSVWADLKAEKLDEKIVLRSDGTSVYMTQDMGTADLKYEDFKLDKSIYVVGNEQDYHFKVLFAILKKLGRSYADGLFHLSYGMVDLPSGKMKSREGTVVDADDLLVQMKEIAKRRTQELGKIDDYSEEEHTRLYEQLALGALKYYLLKVEPKKRMLFNPEESVDFQGDTGIYIQYTHARCSSILRKAKELKIDSSVSAYGKVTKLENLELTLIKLISEYPQKIAEAAQHNSPAIMANYTYELARTYGKFFAELSIFNAENEAQKSLRIALSEQTAVILKKTGFLLGMEMPERM